MKTILILGGYGNFGKRIAESLAALPNIKIIIAGKNLRSAIATCEALEDKFPSANLAPLAVDIFSDQFSDYLLKIKPFLVIHTGGPFQGQTYQVPLAVIKSQSHYIDLADDRRFVCDIGQLNLAALENKLLAVSGASSVPGLSSVVIDFFREKFSHIDSIDIAIAPGNRAERGEATVRAILSYTGHPISVFENAQWTKKYGWMSPRRLDFGSTIGRRWLANVDVPDLELFPARYAPVKQVNFQAGLELPLLHWTMVAMAWLAKKGIVKNWAPWVKPIMKASNALKNFGTDNGGMCIRLMGNDKQKKPLEIEWRLTAEKGVGPYIPTLSAIILTEKLLSNEIITRGAMPCLGLYTMNDFNRWIESWGIYHQTFVNGEAQEIISTSTKRN